MIKKVIDNTIIHDFLVVLSSGEEKENSKQTNELKIDVNSFFKVFKPLDSFQIGKA